MLDGHGAEAGPSLVFPRRCVPSQLLRCGAFLAVACPQMELWHHCMKGPHSVLVPAGRALWAKDWPKVFHKRQFLTLEMVVW